MRIVRGPAPCMRSTLIPRTPHAQDSVETCIRNKSSGHWEAKGEANPDSEAGSVGSAVAGISGLGCV